jgi:hypothetical protein
MDMDTDRDRDGDMDGDMDRDAERDEQRDTDRDRDTEWDRDISVGIRPRGTTFIFEYISEFENTLGYESGVYMGLIYEKNRGKKSCATVPLKSSQLQRTPGDQKTIFNFKLLHS